MSGNVRACLPAALFVSKAERMDPCRAGAFRFRILHCDCSWGGGNSDHSENQPLKNIIFSVYWINAKENDIILI